MARRWTSPWVVLLALFLLTLFGSARAAEAQQPFEAVGTRALGMAGAFVAVANDATAVYWNPAGLATAGPVGLTIGWTRLRSGNQKAAPSPGATGQTSTFTSLGSMPLGLFYGKTTTTTLTTGVSGATGLETLETSQFGATILQSLTKGVVFGSSLKYVRGGVTTGQSTAMSTAEALNQGLDLSSAKSGAFDLDVGLMMDMKRVRLGLTARNLRQPRFADTAGTAITLKRQSRAGIAVMPTNGLTLAMDVDLDTVDLRGDLRRMIAFGGESRLNRRVAVRGGVRWNLKVDNGFRRPVAAAGASVKIRSGLWLEGFYMQGRFDGDRGFGFGLRAGS
jgi:hypothetical protein